MLTVNEYYWRDKIKNKWLKIIHHVDAGIGGDYGYSFPEIEYVDSIHEATPFDITSGLGLDIDFEVNDYDALERVCVEITYKTVEAKDHKWTTKWRCRHKDIKDRVGVVIEDPCTNKGEGFVRVVWLSKYGNIHDIIKLANIEKLED